MSELSKFINLIIEYGQKLQSTINKKYRPFIRSICNLEQLAKSTDPNKIIITKQIIIFKLGLQSKSTKSIELSLYYLQKFFGNKFIDLSQPNHCQEFEIDETTIRKKENVNIKGEMRTQIMKLLQPLVHFKSTEINLLLMKVYEYLITEPIAGMLIELNLLTPNTQLGQKILYNYYSYRFYIFEEKQFRSINPLSIRNEKINAEIQQAFVNHQELLDLVHKYVGEMVVQVAQIGGKYGLCVICKEPADYYCKITKASLCGADCKKRHLQIAQKQYKMYYQAVHLWEEIRESFELLLQSLAKKQSRSLLTVFVGLIEKPNLFMIVKQQFRQLIGKHITAIVNTALNYKDEQCFQLTYNMISMLCRYWMVESISSIEYFFKQCALKLIEDKRPSFKLLIGFFKSLAKIFQYGKTTIQLYINFDCEFNRTNILQRILFELSKMCQDKFASTMFYNKHQKIAIKNGAFTLLNILCKGLNEYRLMYPESLPEIQTEILELKQKKTSLQKFIMKFNELWSQGLKMLFNMNLVGLQSEIQIVDILLTTKGLKKQSIEEMLLNQNGRQYLNVLFQKIIHLGPFMGLVQLFRLIPLKKSSLLLKHYSDFVLQKMLSSTKDDNNQSQEYSVTKWMGFLVSNYGLKELQRYLYMQGIKISGSIEHVYMKCLQTRQAITKGTHKTYFRHCISRSYIKILKPQLSLLQIPILFLLETSYSHEKIFEIIGQLVQICGHGSWIGLCLKSVDVDGMIRTLGGINNGSQQLSSSNLSRKYTLQDHSLVMGCLKECKARAQFIHEWPTILQFINKLHKLLILTPQNKLTIQSSSPSTILLQQTIKIKQQLTILQLQEYLFKIGQNSVENFHVYVTAMIKMAEEQLQKENVFFLQKVFDVLQNNLGKFVVRVDVILGEFEAMLGRIVAHNLKLASNGQNPLSLMKDGQNNIEKRLIRKSIIQTQMINPHNNFILKPPSTPYSSQILIYIADMLKQLFVKILKHLSSVSDSNLSQGKANFNYQSQRINKDKIYTKKGNKKITQKSPAIIQERFFRLFALILQSQNKEANDFVMNSLSMIIMVYSDFLQPTWTFLVEEILKEHCKEYRQQTLTILQKILKEKLHNCEHLEFELINLAIDLVDETEVKLSIQSIHCMKGFVDLMVEQQQGEYKDRSQREGKAQKSIKDKGSLVKNSIQVDKKSEQTVKSEQGKQINQLQRQQNEQYSRDIQQAVQTGQLQQQQQQQQMDSSSSSDSESLISSSPKKIKQYILLIISNLIEFISYQCHEGAIEILFLLMKTKLSQQNQEKINQRESQIKQSPNHNKPEIEQNHSQSLKPIFSPNEITTIMNSIFKKLQSLPGQLLSRGQKIMNESLFWSVRNNNFMIVKNLQECIINKFSKLSYTAMKCIKTFVSMTNPKQPEEWDPIEETLVNILKNTHLTDVLAKGKQQVMSINIEEIIFTQENSKKCKGIDPAHETNLSLTQLSNKLIIQRMAVQVLPNDVKIMEQLLKIYAQTLQFNDNIYLRCLLWRQGLGRKNQNEQSSSLPDILSLQELISYRIISTYYWSKQYQKIADFTLEIIERYCEASKKYEYLSAQQQRMQSQLSDESYELFVICKEYWKKRRQPLKVIINYMLPKMHKICKDYEKKEKLVYGILQGMKFAEQTGQYVETIRLMTMVR